MTSQQSSTPSTSNRTKVRSMVGLATLAVSGIAAPGALAATGTAPSHSPSASGAAAAAATPAAGTATAPATTRIAGADRISTAIAVADAAYGPGKAKATVAVLSRDDSFADALAGNALAAQKKGPLLLTGSAGLDPRVGNELKAVLNSGGTVYLLGGTAALSDKVRADVAALGFVPKRLAGADRFETATLIAGEISPNPHTVLVATGLDAPDALGAGAAAASDPAGGVVLLSNAGVMPTATANYLSHIDPTKVAVYGVGGKAVTALGTQPGYLNHFVPLAGIDRFDTATRIASNTTLFPAPTGVGIATGAFWADALSGGAYVGALHQPLLLVDKAIDGLRSGELDWLKNQGGKISSVTVFGGAQAVSDKAVAGAATAAGIPTGTGTGTGPVAAPTAALTSTAVTAGTGQAVTFDGVTSKPGSTAIASYSFNFGDKSAPVVVNAPVTSATHSFAKKGTYHVVLTVTDVDGGTSTATAVFAVGTATSTGGWTSVGTTGLLLQVADMDSHHNTGSKGTKPSPWCNSPGVVAWNDPAASTAPILFYGASDDHQWCGNGWDTPGIMIKNPTGAAVQVNISVSVKASPAVVDSATQIATAAGNKPGSWALWQTVTLNPGQSVIFAQTDTPGAANNNNFDPADTNYAGQIGAPSQWCQVPSQTKPVIKVTVNGKVTSVTDNAQALNGHGADPAGCNVPSSGSNTRSDESFNWMPVN